jgi:hypothetical protein
MVSSAVLEALRSALVELYPSHGDAGRVAADAGLNPARIAYDPTPIVYWHNVLLEAQRLGKIGAVVDVAQREYGENALLQAAVRLWNAKTETAGPPHELGASSPAAELDPVVLTLLADEVRRGRLTIFVGSNLSMELTGLPPLADVGARLAARYSIASGGDEPFYVLAQRVAGRSRSDLLLFLREQLDGVFEPGPFDRMLSQLPIKLIITTRYDGLIEDAFQAARRSIDVLTDGFGVGQRRGDSVGLLKLYGDLLQPRSLTLTEDDINDLFDVASDKRGLVALAVQAFGGGTVLAFGVDAREPGFARLVGSAARTLGDSAPMVYVVRDADAEDGGVTSRRNVEFIDAPPLDMLTSLLGRLA